MKYNKILLVARFGWQMFLTLICNCNTYAFHCLHISFIFPLPFFIMREVAGGFEKGTGFSERTELSIRNWAGRKGLGQLIQLWATTLPPSPSWTLREYTPSLTFLDLATQPQPGLRGYAAKSPDRARKNKGVGWPHATLQDGRMHWAGPMSPSPERTCLSHERTWPSLPPSSLLSVSLNLRANPSPTM